MNTVRFFSSLLQLRFALLPSFSQDLITDYGDTACARVPRVLLCKWPSLITVWTAKVLRAVELLNIIYKADFLLFSISRISGAEILKYSFIRISAAALLWVAQAGSCLTFTFTLILCEATLVLSFHLVLSFFYLCLSLSLKSSCPLLWPPPPDTHTHTRTPLFCPGGIHLPSDCFPPCCCFSLRLAFSILKYILCVFEVCVCVCVFMRVRRPLAGMHHLLSHV